jgi:type IV pilus assembly protein PilM
MNQSGNSTGLWQRMWMNPSLGWGCEISEEGVCLARWDGSSSGLGAVAWRPLTVGAVEVTPLRENLLRFDEVREALTGCLGSLGRADGAQSSSHPLDIALVIPDQAARVFFLTFDSFPEKPAEAIPLVQWKLKKSVPFDIETSTVSYVAVRGPSDWYVLAVVSPAAIVQQYEALANALGLKPRFVTLSTLGSLGLVPTEDSGAADGRFLVAKYSPPWLTTAIVYQNSVRLFRTAAIGSGTQSSISGAAGTSTNWPGAGISGAAGSALREILEAILPSAAYFQDNFGMPIEKAFLCGFGEYTESIIDALTSELHLPTESLLRDTGPGIGGWAPGETDRHLAALSGIARVRRHG